MEAQVTRLKINATNLKNSLVGYNKELRKLRVEENRLIFESQKKEQAKEKEKKVESDMAKTIQNVKSRILAGPLGFFDKVKEFLGVVLLGLFINNFSKIVDGLKQFFSDNSWLIDVTKVTLKLLSDGIMGMIWLVTEYPKSVMTAMNNERRYVAKEIDRTIAIAQSAYNIWNKFLNPTQDPVPNKGFGLPGSPGSMYPSTTPSSPSSSPSPTSPSPGSGNPPVSKQQRFAKGGTVKAEGQQSSKNTISGGFKGVTSTPLGKKAIESVDSFENFSNVASGSKLNSQLLADRDGINDTFTKVNESFSQFLNSIKGKDNSKPPGSPKPPPTPPGGAPPGSTAPSVPGNGKISGGAIVTQRNDPDGQQTGIDIALQDSSGGYGIGALIRNPFESLKITGTGFEGSGSGRTGKGFGLYVTGEAVVDNKRYELLVAHLDKAHVNEGDVLSGGDSIGTQGMSGHATGPHVSTHINALDGGNAQLILNDVEKSWINGTIIKSQNLKPGKSKVNPVVSSTGNLLNVLKRGDETLQNETTYLITQTFIQPTPIVIPGLKTTEVNDYTNFSYGNSAFSNLS